MYRTAMMTERGVASFLDVDPDAGTFGVRPELLVDTFLQDCDSDVQTQAPAHLTRQSVQVTGQPVGAAAWHHVPSTYLVCTQDKGTWPGFPRATPPSRSGSPTSASTPAPRCCWRG